MTLNQILFSQVLLVAFSACSAFAIEEREWKDSSGHYRVKAELIAYNSKSVVLQKTNKELLSMDVKDLSAEDKKFIQSIKRKAKTYGAVDSLKTWTMQSGLKVKGRVVEFARRDVKFQLEDGKIYVNDRPLENLPGVYQEMAPGIVNHFEKTFLKDNEGVAKWLGGLTNQEKSFTCEGVLFELENGDRYGVPMFFFSKSNQSALDPSWKRWAAAHKDETQQDQESFYLRAQAQATDENVEQIRHIAQVNLQIQGYNAGLFDLWEVALYPPNGFNYRPMYVVVPGRNSDDAARAALQKQPNARVGSISKIRRRR